MNLFNRAIGGAIILALLILITFLGRIPLAIGVMIFSYIALHEMKEALEKIGITLPMKLLYVTNTIIMLAAYVNNSDIYIASLVVSVIFMMMYIILRGHYLSLIHI